MFTFSGTHSGSQKELLPWKKSHCFNGEAYL